MNMPNLASRHHWVRAWNWAGVSWAVCAPSVSATVRRGAAARHQELIRVIFASAGLIGRHDLGVRVVMSQDGAKVGARFGHPLGAFLAKANAVTRSPAVHQHRVAFGAQFVAVARQNTPADLPRHPKPRGFGAYTFAQQSASVRAGVVDAYAPGSRVLPAVGTINGKVRIASRVAHQHADRGERACAASATGRIERSERRSAIGQDKSAGRPRRNRGWGGRGGW